jgi:hypothetical protein
MREPLRRARLIRARIRTQREMSALPLALQRDLGWPQLDSGEHPHATHQFTILDE